MGGEGMWGVIVPLAGTRLAVTAVHSGEQPEEAVPAWPSRDGGRGQQRGTGKVAWVPALRSITSETSTTNRRASARHTGARQNATPLHV